MSPTSTTGQLPNETDVLIVGGGPVGLALAAELGWRGVDCVLVEAHGRPVQHSKMNLVNIRTMEFCRRWGIADAVRNTPFPDDHPHDVAFVTSMKGHELGRLPRPSGRDRQVTPHSPETYQHCPQMWFDPILQDLCDTLPSVTMLHCCRLEGFHEEEGRVLADLVDEEAGMTSTLAARFLVGCDGAGSAVRASLGIALQGPGALGRSMHGFFRAAVIPRAPEIGVALRYMLVNAEGVWGNLLSIDGHDLWRIALTRVPDDAQPGDIDMDAVLRNAVGCDVPHEWRGVLAWTRRQLVAERYGKGRVFIAGDAAHQLSPTGGFGMNTGIGDSVDLGWKLAAVLAGWGGAALLDSYDIERRPVGLRNVAAAGENYRRWIIPQEAAHLDDDTAEAAQTRHELGAALADSLRIEFEAEGVQLGYRYDPSPLCVPDGTEAPPDDPVVYVPSARPGSRAPHVQLGHGRSTLDLFGRGFVLLRLGSRPPDPSALIAAAGLRRVPLRVATLPEPPVHAAYETALVLVRPDGHVAWRADAIDRESLALIDRVRGAVPSAASRAAE